MNNTLLSFQIVVSVMIVALILLQSQGTSTSPLFGGGGESYHTRRGMEKVLFYLTISLVVIFALISLAVIVI